MDQLVLADELFFRDGRSDKVYQLWMLAKDVERGNVRFEVWYAYGRRGQPLRMGLKTIGSGRAAENLQKYEAERLYLDVRQEKLREGYKSGLPYSVNIPKPADIKYPPLLKAMTELTWYGRDAVPQAKAKVNLATLPEARETPKPEASRRANASAKPKESAGDLPHYEQVKRGGRTL